MIPAISSTVERVEAKPAGFVRLIPGVILLTAIGYAGKVTEQSIAAYGKAHHLALPNIEYVLWSHLIRPRDFQHRGYPGRVSPRHRYL